MTRAESLAAFFGLDDALRSIEQVIESGVAPRHYEVVLVSDHGQSQGATFRQRYGHSLEELIRQHLDDGQSVAAATNDVEAWGPVNLLLGQLSRQDSVSGRLTRRAISDRDPEAPVAPRGGDVKRAPGDGDEPADLTVVGSGNLGGVWFSQHPTRLTAEDIESMHPGLLGVLAAHPGIGFVVVMTGPRMPWHRCRCRCRCRPGSDTHPVTASGRHPAWSATRERHRARTLGGRPVVRRGRLQ